MANEEETKMADFKLGLRNKVRVQIQHGGLGLTTQIKLGLDPLRDLGFNPLRGFPIVLGLCINLLIVTHITTGLKLVQVTEFVKFVFKSINISLLCKDTLPKFFIVSTAIFIVFKIVNTFFA